MIRSELLPRRGDGAALALLTLAYTVLALAGLNWGVWRGATTAVWPASGLALAALLLGGVRLWPAIVIGRLAAAIIVDSAPPLWGDIIIALASGLSTALPAMALSAKRFDPRMTRMSDALVLIVAALLGGLISALPGIGVLLASGVSTPALAPMALLTWLLGHVTGTLLLTPLILSWARIRTEPGLLSWKLAAGVTAGSIAAFVVFLHLTPLPLRTWHLFPVLAWVAIAFSVRGVSLALVATAVAALISVQVGVGPLSDLIAGAPAALYAQDFIAVTAATLLLLAAATDESRSQSALARAQATKAAVFDAALDAIVTMAADGRVVDWNPEAERMFGLSKRDAVGRDLADLIIPAAYREAHRRGLALHVETGQSHVLGRRLEMHALRQGKAFPVELSISVVTLEDGQHYTAHLRDLTDQIAARDRLAEQEQRLRATYERASVGIAEVDATGRILKVNEQLCAITGRDRQSLLNMTIWDDSDPDSQDEERWLFKQQMAGELDSYTLEKTFVRASGEVAWVELRASRVDGADGRAPYGVRVVRDITQEKRWARQQSLLINELNHRVKNTLTTVQSITFQTLRNGGADLRLQTAIENRLVALSRAHDVLTRENWETADLAEIIAVAAKPYVVGQAGRLSTQGPAVALTPQVALGFAMALQELATNALKYGAWSTPEGVVEITWTRASADPRAIELVWQESGGPPVTKPERRGFGARLLERGVGAEVGGTCKLDFASTGLVCRISATLTGYPVRDET